MEGKLRIPGEWERHEACWVGFPHLADEWPGTLERAQASIAALCGAIAGPGEERVRLLVLDEATEDAARRLIGDSPGIEYLRVEYGDCWIRDTAPLFGRTADGALGALSFSFNCWGGKYDIPFDDSLAERLTDQAGAKAFECPVTLEGGALETDGRGTFLTTTSCVLNANRNPNLTEEAFEDVLGSRVVVERLIWLDEGLPNDDTDGHVDMVARFAPNGAVLCMRPDPSAPNARVLDAIARQLDYAGLSLLELPPAPALHGPGGAQLPASYCNFYVANRAVIAPVYDVPEDAEALTVLADAFPDREVIGLRARDLLCGGGAFHCATQPEPS